MTGPTRTAREVADFICAYAGHRSAPVETDPEVAELRPDTNRYRDLLAHLVTFLAGRRGYESMLNQVNSRRSCCGRELARCGRPAKSRGQAAKATIGRSPGVHRCLRRKAIAGKFIVPARLWRVRAFNTSIPM